MGRASFSHADRTSDASYRHRTVVRLTDSWHSQSQTAAVDPKAHPMGKSSAARRSPLTWTERLVACRTEAEVVEACREWLAAWSPQDIASLPPACRPGKLHDADDIAALAFDAVRCGNATDGSPHPQVQRLASFFSHASTRVAEIMAGRRDPRARDGETIQ